MCLICVVYAISNNHMITVILSMKHSILPLTFQTNLHIERLSKIRKSEFELIMIKRIHYLRVVVYSLKTDEDD